MIEIQFVEVLTEGSRAMKAQSLSRLMRRELTHLSIKTAHIKAGGQFYLNTKQHISRKHYMSVLRKIYVGPTKYVYFLTSDKEIYPIVNAKRVNTRGETAERRYTIRRFDLTSPGVIDIPFPHIFREYGTSQRALSTISRMVINEWTSWVERVNDISSDYRDILYEEAYGTQKNKDIKAGVYTYTPSERFKMILNSII